MTHDHGHPTGSAEAAPGSPQFWEEFYRAEPQVFSGRVNPILATVAEHLRPGTALDLGAGEGGDTAWLAERGWAVTAVDVSATALERLQQRAGGVTVERHDLTATFPEGTFDLVSAQYLQSPDDGFPRAAILCRAAEAVAPGGTLLIVGHGGHVPHAMPTADEVLVALALDPDEWDVERCETVPRVVTRPDGEEVSVPDEIVQVGRSADRVRRAMDTSRKLQATKVIDASPETVFALLSDPGRHQEIDDAGMIRGVEGDAVPIKAIGQVFTMNMHQDALGDYRMVNAVTAYVPGARIGWAPRMDPTCELAGKLGDMDASGHTYTYDLREVDGGTEVTQTYEWMSVKDEEFLKMFPLVSQEQLAASLDRLGSAVS